MSTNTATMASHGSGRVGPWLQAPGPIYRLKAKRRGEGEKRAAGYLQESVPGYQRDERAQSELWVGPTTHYFPFCDDQDMLHNALEERGISFLIRISLVHIRSNILIPSLKCVVKNIRVHFDNRWAVLGRVVQLRPSGEKNIIYDPLTGLASYLPQCQYLTKAKRTRQVSANQSTYLVSAITLMVAAQTVSSWAGSCP